MSELSDFRIQTLRRLKNESVAGGSSYSEEFIRYVSELLIGSEEISEDIVFCHYEGFAPGGKRKIQISGYSYDDFEQCLNLFVVTPETGTDSLETLTNDEIDRLFSRCEGFVDFAEFITKNAEESHPAYGLAADIYKKNKPIDEFCLYIVSDRIKTKNREVLLPSKRDDGTVVRYSIIDIERIFQMESSSTGKAPLVINFEELTENRCGIPCMLANRTPDYVSYLCNIPGMLLASLYNEYGSRLLEGNVRSFLQNKNKVNKGIRNTILKEPDNFFIYNNGITATAEEITCEGSYIKKITGLQIVNGGQTTASLASCLLNDKRDGSVASISKISVPMKLTVVSFDQALKLIPAISRYANSQNKVSEADLWSNHPFHVEMENISRRLATPLVNGVSGTYWYYERARGQYKQSTYKKTESEKKKFERLNPKKQLLTKTDFAKYLNIRDLHPEYASLGGEKSFFKIAQNIASQWDKNKTQFNELFFKEVVSIAILYKDVDSIVKKQGREYKANIDAYTVSFFLYLISVQFEGYHLNYKDIWNKQAVRSEIHDELEKLSDTVYAVLTWEDRPVENVTEWAKREACWTRLKNQPCKINPKLVDFLLTEDEYYGEKKDARREARELSQDQAMIEVVNYGADFWDRLLQWNNRTKELDYQDIKLLNKALNIKIGKIPTGKESLLLMRVLEKARENGYLE